MSKQGILDWFESKEDALWRFVADFRDIFQCLDNSANVYVAPGLENDPLILSVKVESISKVRNERNIPLLVLETNSSTELFLQAVQQIQIKELDGKYSVSTKYYVYQLQDTPQTKIFGWHYHPEDPKSPIPFPHLQLYQKSGNIWFDLMRKKHIPSGRVSAEQVVRFLINELEIEPAPNHDWNGVLERTEADFESRKNWGQKEPHI